MTSESTNMLRLGLVAVLGLGLSVGLLGCGDQSNGQTGGQNRGHDHDHDHDHEIVDVDRLVAVMRPTEGNSAQGVVIFERVNGEVRATARISGLNPGQQHAIHVHAYGDDRSDDGTSTGGHYNPEGHDHGLPDESQRHAGDLGNLSADDEGNAEYEIVVENVTIAGTYNPIIGRAVIIHAEADDGSQPTGAAGARIASGIIGVANPEIE